MGGWCVLVLVLCVCACRNCGEEARGTDHSTVTESSRDTKHSRGQKANIWGLYARNLSPDREGDSIVCVCVCVRVRVCVCSEEARDAGTDHGWVRESSRDSGSGSLEAMDTAEDKR